VILLDVNILVYAHREDVPDHARYRDWLERSLDDLEPVGVSELVLSGCLRIITHPKVFTPPTPIAKALDYVGQLRDHPNSIAVSPGERHWDIFVRLCREANVKGNLVSDAYHAALAIECGSLWISTDGDFARFPGLRWQHPFA